jgi:hypothetical protein
MYSKIITAVALVALCAAPALAGKPTIGGSHTQCYRGKCAAVHSTHTATVTHHGSVTNGAGAGGNHPPGNSGQH